LLLVKVGTVQIFMNSLNKSKFVFRKKLRADCKGMLAIIRCGILLSSSLLSKNLKITIHRTIILPVVVYGCETWSLTLRVERRLNEFENRVLRRILGPKRDGVTGEWKKIHHEELNDAYSSPNIVRERVHLEDPGVDGNIILRCIFRKWDVRIWTGSIWLRKGTGSGHL
jgi:hypothetical protein